MKKHSVVFKPESIQEYAQSLNVISVNKIITSEELDKIKKFRRERNKSIHNIFKSMSRIEWDKQNKRVIELGRPLIKELDIKISDMVNQT